MKIGVISDTHGLLRPEAVAALQGCEQILHAGDIGGADIVEQLARIAPLHVVRGNNDQDAPWARQVPDHLHISLNGWISSRIKYLSCFYIYYNTHSFLFMVFDIGDKIVKEISRIMRSRTCFRMILNRKTIFIF